MDNLVEAKDCDCTQCAGLNAHPVEKIRGVVHINSMIRTGRNFEDERVVELVFESPRNANTSSHTTVVVDRATAARMINQLRKVLDA